MEHAGKVEAPCAWVLARMASKQAPRDAPAARGAA